MRYALFCLLCLPALAFASPLTPITSDSQLTWLLVSMLLVLFMALPGVSLFYAGQVNNENVLSVSTLIFITATVMAILWVVIGYSLVFTSGSEANMIIGGLDDHFFHRFMYYFSETINYQNIHSFIYVGYEMGFAIIAPMLIIGGFPGRSRVLSVVIFLIFWELLVYYPVAHWVWGGGWLEKMGLMDFAGGTAVHINAGSAGLVGALMVGKRKGFPRHIPKPHNMLLVSVGTSILWLGWFGFNSGAAPNMASALHIVLVSYLAASCGGLSWILTERVVFGGISPMGILFGIVSGLVAITPACAFVSGVGSLIIGFVSGVACSLLSQLKFRLGYDDSLDAFGVHGFGGIVGSLLTGVFATTYLGGAGIRTASMGMQVGVQLAGVLATLLWSSFVSFILLLILRKTLGVRISERDEDRGLDITWLNQGL